MLFVHSSDELYGADRMLLATIDAVEDPSAVEVWLPTDLPHPHAPLCAELVERGVQVRHLDLPVLRRAYRTPAGLTRFLARARKIARELDDRSDDVLYCTSSAVLPVAWAGRRSRRVRETVLHLQEIWSPADARILGPLAARCTTIIAISDAAKASLPGALTERTVVVPNATADPGPVAPVGEHDGPLHFVIASRWNGWKGHRTLLRAWELAGSPGHLTVLGGPPPSGAAIDVPALVRALPDPTSVSVVGEVSEPLRHLAQADVAVVPSEAPEPFGLVAIEAFAAGRPVIASAAGGLRDVVEGTGAGWLFPPGDAFALADVLTGLTRADVVRSAVLARERFESAYTLDSYRRSWRDAMARSISERESGDTH